MRKRTTRTKAKVELVKPAPIKRSRLNRTTTGWSRSEEIKKEEIKEEEIPGLLGGLQYPKAGPFTFVGSFTLPPHRRSLSYHPRTPQPSDFRSPSYQPEQWVPPRSPTPEDPNDIPPVHPEPLGSRLLAADIDRLIQEVEARQEESRINIYAAHYAWRGLVETIHSLGESTGNLVPRDIFEI